jgi:hypothetical protein
MVDTTRRWILKGLAAAPVAGATAGGQIATAAASALGTAASAAGASDALTKAARLTKVWQGIAQTGGFPDMAVRHIFSSSSRFTFYSRLPHKRKETGADAITALQNRLFGGGEWFRNAPSPDKPNPKRDGKISITQETRFLDCLSDLPRDVPLLDLLSKDVFEGSRQPESVASRKPHLFLWGDTPLKPEDVERLRSFVAPYCNADTTAGDIIGRLEGYFTRLARHAITCPDDLEEGHEDDPFRSSMFGMDGGTSPLNNLIRVLEGYKKPGQTEEPPVLDELKTVRKQYVDQQRALALAQQNKREELWKELEENRQALKKQEEAARFTKTALRSQWSVTLAGGEDNCFVLQDVYHNSGTRRVTRMDWLHWVQSIDPQNAKPSDIELGCGGLSVTIRNKAALAALKANPIHNRNVYTVTLPNRRMGADLNDRPDSATYHAFSHSGPIEDMVRSMVQDLNRPVLG